MERGGFHGGPAGHFGGDHGGMEMGGFHLGPGGMWWKNPRIVERLSLTADQARKMDDIVERSRLDLIDLRANLEKQQVMLGPLMDANPVDAARASAQIDKVANARADLEKANAKMLLGIRGVLTPDQWTKLHERPTPPAQSAAPSRGPERQDLLQAAGAGVADVRADRAAAAWITSLRQSISHSPNSDSIWIHERAPIRAPFPFESALCTPKHMSCLCKFPAAAVLRLAPACV